MNATGPSTVRLLPPLTIEAARGRSTRSGASSAGAREGVPEPDAAQAAGGFELDDDPERVDVDAVHAFLAHDAYWGRGRPKALLERAIRGSSRVVGLYRKGEQIGFGRAISDAATVAYLADVYVLAPYRGRGLGLELVREIVDAGADYGGAHVAAAHRRCSGPLREVRFQLGAAARIR